MKAGASHRKVPREPSALGRSDRKAARRGVDWNRHKRNRRKSTEDLKWEEDEAVGNGRDCE